jgi:hypothetical protein
MRYWIKALGSTHDPLPDDWRARNNGVLINHATFPWRPGAVRKGDRIVYYATGKRVVFAVGTVTTQPYEDPDNAAGFNWRVGIHLDLAKDFLHDGVPLEMLDQPTSHNRVGLRIKRRSHVQLSVDEFHAAVNALSAS